MAIKTFDKVKQGPVWFKSGYVYSFQYANYMFDPEPTVIVVNSVKGVHPTTGHRHNFLQAINFTYIPRSQRRIFIRQWTKNIKQYAGNVTLSWLDIKRMYPFMELAFRRYFLDKGYIKNVIEIPTEDMENVVVKSWEADYSKRAFMIAVTRNTGGKGNKGVSRRLSEPLLVKKLFGGAI